MILDYIERVTALSEMSDVWDYHTKVMSRFGFNRILYGMTRFRTGNSIGDPRDFLILTNHDQSYLQPFIDDALYIDAPMINWALNNTGSKSWREAEVMARDGSMPKAARRVWEFNKSQGLGAGYSISFRSNSVRTRASIDLTGVPALDFDSVDALWAEHGRILEAMNNVLHLRLSLMPNPGRRRPLTARQREVLEWVGDGKTTADIAEIMGVTPATVEKHLRLAREGLDVATTAQAVLKASLQNQIFGVGG